MNISRKILIPVFATSLGLSIIGGLTGAVAWYQYNSKVSVSFVGASVADTGVLQIKEGADGSWTRDVKNDKLDPFRPMTFGKTSVDGVPANGWMNPEAGAGNGYYESVEAGTDGTGEMNGWLKAEKGKQYVQFDLYFNAFQTDDTAEAGKGYKPVARNVYLSKYLLRCIDANGNELDDKVAADAMRIQFDIDDNEHLILANDVSTTKLYGPLDLDGSGTADKYHKNPFNVLPTGAQDGNEIVYGVDQETQTTVDIDDYVVVEDKQANNGAQSALFATKGKKDEFTHVVITIWLEGWAMLDSENGRAEWNAFTSAGYDVQVALQFTTGIFRGNDLSN